MLTWLELMEDASGAELQARWPDWTFLSPPDFTPQRTAERNREMMDFLTLAYQDRPAETTAKGEAFLGLKSLLPFVPDEHLSFALNAYLAHHRAETRSDRIAIVNSQIDQEITLLGSLAAPHATALKAWRQLACLLPPQYLRQCTRGPLLQLRQSLYEQHPKEVPFKTWASSFDRLGNALVSQKVPAADSVLEEVRRVVLTRPVVALPDTWRHIDQLIKTHRLGIVQAVVEERRRLPASLPWVNLHDVVAQGMKDAAMDSMTPLTQVANTAVDWLAEIEQLNVDETLRRAVQTVDAGESLGEPKTTESRQALTRMREIDAQNDHRMAALQAAWLQDARPADMVVALVERTADQATADAVSSWSVDRLLAWIEGPLAQPANRAVALDRRRVAQAARRSRAVPAGPAQPPSQAAEEAPEDPETLAEVDHLIQNGLAATAEFFLGDCRDLVTAAKRLQIPDKTVRPCQALLADLKALATDPTTPSETAARDLLARAESALDALRLSVGHARTLDSRLQRFQDALLTALKRNPIVLGKRHGGEIAFPLQPVEWGDVVQRLHGKRLAPSHTLWQDSTTRLSLREDQALALYVTASSESKYLFDVSVHLWRRRAGCTTPPALSTEPLAAMNTADWFDTYIPCLVLHVPQAR